MAYLVVEQGDSCRLNDQVQHAGPAMLSLVSVGSLVSVFS